MGDGTWFERGLLGSRNWLGQLEDEVVGFGAVCGKGGGVNFGVVLCCVVVG